MNKLGHISVKGAEGKLFSCTAVFPFQLFPDTLRLDESKLTVVQRGFLTRKVTPIQLPDLLNVEVMEAPLFATVRVYAKYMTMAEDWLEIAYLRKDEATKLRRLVNELKAEKQATTNTGGQ